jgi:hypothetical protein
MGTKEIKPKKFFIEERDAKFTDLIETIDSIEKWESGNVKALHFQSEYLKRRHVLETIKFLREYKHNLQKRLLELDLIISPIKTKKNGN